MTKINWKVRLANPTFWWSVIPMLALIIEGVLRTFGIDVEIPVLQGALTDIINGVLAILALTGIVVDHTTEGVGDSERALSYNEPAAHDRY